MPRKSIFSARQLKSMVGTAKADPAWEVCPPLHNDILAELLLNTLSIRDEDSLKGRTALEVVDAFERLKELAKL